MKFIKKLLPVLFIVVFGLFNAQTPGTPCGFGSWPPCPVAPPSAIDMYVYVLAIVAITTIAFFAKKYKTQKI